MVRRRVWAGGTPPAGEGKGRESPEDLPRRQILRERASRSLGRGGWVRLLLFLSLSILRTLAIEAS